MTISDKLGKAFSLILFTSTGIESTNGNIKLNSDGTFSFSSSDKGSLSMGTTNHPSVSGLNVGEYGIVSEAGINCPNIGCDGTFTVKCTTLDLTGPTVEFKGSAYVKIGDRTLSEYVNDVAEATFDKRIKGYATTEYVDAAIEEVKNWWQK